MFERQIELIPVGSLRPYERNARTHSAAQIKQVEKSITEFGFTNPILVDQDGGIIAGHGRWIAAKNLGIAAVPCLRLSHMTEEQKRAYIIADNKLAENAGWDAELLRLEIGALIELGFDVDLLGFGADDLEKMLADFDAGSGLVDENDVPGLPEDAETVVGDVWQLGAHRIACGSCTDAGVVSSLLAGDVPHLMVTDPPYGVEYDASWRDDMKGNRSKGAAKGKVLNDHIADWRDAWALFPGDVAYVWHASVFSNTVADSLLACGLEIRSQIVWAKNQLVISRGNYHQQHEPCWYAVKKGRTAHWNGSRKKSTLWRDIDDVLRDGEDVFVRRRDAEIVGVVSGDMSTLWEIAKPLKSETGHSTQKPVECMRRPILNNSKRGDFVYEPFSGSGTTIIAAEQTGRKCLAVELNPVYVDVAVRRWENFSGKKAVLLTANGA